MAVFNGRRFIDEQLDSVCSQLEPGDELILVDDASTDGTAGRIAELTDSRIRIFANPRNIGVVRSFERGLGLASNEIIFLCDQDDRWLPGKRQAFVSEFLRDKKVLLVISDAEVISGAGDIVAPSFMATRGGFNGTIVGTLWRNRYLGCAMAVRRELLQIALPIPGRVPMHDVWFGLLAQALGQVVYLPTPYLQYRRHGKNVTPERSSRPWTQLLRWRLALLMLLLARFGSVKLGRHRLPTGTRPR